MNTTVKRAVVPASLALAVTGALVPVLGAEPASAMTMWCAAYPPHGGGSEFEVTTNDKLTCCNASSGYFLHPHY